MSKYYQDLDCGAFDYDLHAIPDIPAELFRGPEVDRSLPYIVCVGAAQTFGRFCAQPYTHLLSEQLGIQVLNLGIGGAGPRRFNMPQYLEWLNGAEAVIVQVLSGRSESNSLFDNSEQGKLRGIRKSDGVSMRYERFLDELISTSSAEAVEKIVTETRENYVSIMVRLLQSIRRPKILFWFSGRSPAYKPDFTSAALTLGSFPHLVDDSMLNALTPHADLQVKHVSTVGLPQRLWSANAPIDGAPLKNGFLFNVYYPSPQMHAKAAQLLAKACKRLLPSLPESGSTPHGQPAAKRAVRFIVLCAERTGSNLLLSMLGSHPDCFTAGELFNPALMRTEVVPGMPTADREMLIELRRKDPAAFMQHVFESNEDLGFQAVGFKMMYYHATVNAKALEMLVEDTGVRVIHLKRKNLLRRFVSHQQAKLTGVWGQSIESRVTAPPPVRLSFHDAVENIIEVEKQQTESSERFKHHEVMEVFYEDLSENAQQVGASVAAFVGLSVGAPLAIKHQKTGSNSLREALVNHDELKAKMLDWAASFDA